MPWSKACRARASLHTLFNEHHAYWLRVQTLLTGISCDLLDENPRRVSYRRSAKHRRRLRALNRLRRKVGA